MKKKAIKIAASTAVAASAFVAAAPAQQADAATNVNQLITDAQNAGTVLKWAISVEGSANFVDRPYDHYNAAKKAIANAEKAAAKLSASEKLSADAKLVEPKLQVKRAGAYIDAITSSEKIKTLTAGLDAAIKTNDIEKVEAAYHTATAEYRKQAALLDRVYGQSTRDEIRNKVKPTIEKLVADVKNEVTVSMLAKSAAANAKAGKFEEAAKNLSDAQAILDANNLKWETALQKSVTDVEASIPLSVTGIVSDNKNTVVVSFSTKLEKGATTLPAGQFTFTNGLIVQSATVAADGKTVTLKTTDQKTSTTYALSYQGKESGKSFTTPASATDTTLVINDTVETFLENGKERGYTARITKIDGTPYTGKVNIQLLDATDATTVLTAAQAGVSKVNGVAPTLVTATNGDISFEANAVDGVLTFVLTDGTNDAAVSVLPKVTKYENNTPSFKFAGITNFNPAALENSVTTTTVTSVAKTSDSTFHLNGFIFNYDANDQYFIRNQEVTATAFFAALSKGDAITFNYRIDKSLISTFRIDSDVTQTPAKELKITNANADLVVTHDQEAFRLVGTGQPGEIIEVYRTGGDYVAQIPVDANGNWAINSVNLLDGQNNLVVTSRNVAEARGTIIDTVNSDDTKFVTIYRANYTPGVVLNDVDASGTISNNDVIAFTPQLVGVNNYNSKIAANATITVMSNNFKTAQFRIEPTANANEARIVGIVSAQDGFNSQIAGDPRNTLYVEAVTGVTNQDNLVWKPKAAGADNILSPVVTP